MTELLDLVDAHYRGLETGDLELAASPFAETVASEFPAGPMVGIEALRGLIQAFITAFPDLKLARRNVWVSGDSAVAEVTFSGTHTGPLATPDGTVPPTGKAVTFPLIDIFTLRDGKVVEHRGYWDNALFLTQLGLLPAPAGA
ncbi:ester cyclase [Nocardia sp. alder85J]|uniref:ester cyclase n=1 Tax=Nocardia sp. alder85J TaxID=2862949 RepID=UPI001CD5596B|nr:ester cyclase [Nocardia sp. alder85J]MCX4095565.1 ester cyclase [Nocardia sp. alder85J]